jgi:hypothetical protein
VNCHIDGPAVIVPQDTWLSNSDLGGPSPDAVLWEILPERTVVVGAILAKGCTFDVCEFRNVGFAGPTGFIEEVKQGTGLAPA